MYDLLQTSLSDLSATGPLGFEGLIHSLIASLTGRHFFLAKAGSQLGKDSTTAGLSGTHIDIECKRYRRGASPPARELLGELGEAITASRERLDLWLLVSTGPIGATEGQKLREFGDAQGL